MSRFRVGQRVCDRDADEDVELVVFDPDRGDASAVHIEALDRSVAEVNDEYPADDRVVECIHVEWLDRHVTDWETWDPNTFPEHLRAYTDEWSLPLQTYSYPESRLEPRGGRDAPTDVGEGQSSLADWSP